MTDAHAGAPTGTQPKCALHAPIPAHLLQQLCGQARFHWRRPLLRQPQHGIEQLRHGGWVRRVGLVRHDQLPRRLGVCQQAPRGRVQRVGQLLALPAAQLVHAGKGAALVGHGGGEGGAQQRLRHQSRRRMVLQRCQHQALQRGKKQLTVGSVRGRRQQAAGSGERRRQWRRPAVAPALWAPGGCLPSDQWFSGPHLQALHLRLVAILAHGRGDGLPGAAPAAVVRSSWTTVLHERSGGTDRACKPGFRRAGVRRRVAQGCRRP